MRPASVSGSSSRKARLLRWQIWCVAPIKGMRAVFYMVGGTLRKESGSHKIEHFVKKLATCGYVDPQSTPVEPVAYLHLLFAASETYHCCFALNSLLQ